MGFGIYVFEIGWDDYKDFEVGGKIVLVFFGILDEFMEGDLEWKGDFVVNIYSKGFYKRNEVVV